MFNEQCYYSSGSQGNLCQGALWECRTCGEIFCQAHFHETDLGYNIECVACETERLVREEEESLKPRASVLVADLLRLYDVEGCFGLEGIGDTYAAETAAQAAAVELAKGFADYMEQAESVAALDEILDTEINAVMSLLNEWRGRVRQNYI